MIIYHPGTGTVLDGDECYVIPSMYAEWFLDNEPNEEWVQEQAFVPINTVVDGWLGL